MLSVEEKILLNEIKKGNRQVYRELFNEYYSDLIFFAESFVFDREGAEDIVQNIFIYLWEHADRVNINTSLKSYLCQSVRNRCLNYLRDLKVEDKHNLLYLEAILHDDNRQWDDAILSREIKAVLKKLPKGMATVFELKYLKNRKQKEIAEYLHISENTVKTQLLRARVKVRKLLAESTTLNLFL